MNFLQQYRKPNGALTTKQEYGVLNTPLFEEARDAAGNVLMLVEGITDHEFYSFTKIGHKADKTDFDESTCFERGIIEALKVGIKNAEESKE